MLILYYSYIQDNTLSICPNYYSEIKNKTITN